MSWRWIFFQNCQPGCTSCDACTANCVSGFQTECVASCVDCQTSCTSCTTCDGFTSDCQGSCQTGCQGSCVSSCQGSCQTGCDNNCQTGWTGSCHGTCNSTCYGACTSCDGCTGFCQGGCQTGCQASCTGCTSGCTGCTSCNGGCQTCQGCTECTAGCYDSTCQTCNSNCYGSAVDTCRPCDGCLTACAGGCDSTCYGGCTSGCDSGCTTGCDGGCTSGCQAGCTTGCDGGCQGSCEGDTGHKTYDYYCYPGQGNTSGENTSCSGGGYDGEADPDLNPPIPEYKGTKEQWSKLTRQEREAILKENGYEIKDHGVDTSEDPGIPLKELGLQNENVKLIVDKDENGNVKYTYVDKDTGEVKGEITKNAETGEYTGWSESSDGTHYEHDYDYGDPTDGFAEGTTTVQKPGTDYTTTTDTKNDGETTATDPNTGQDVPVDPSGAGC